MRIILKWALVILVLVIIIAFAVNTALYMNYKRNIKTGSVSYNPNINSIYVNQDIPVHFKEGRHPHVYYHVNKNSVPHIKDAGHILSLSHSSRNRPHLILGRIHISLSGIKVTTPEYITVVLPQNHHISTLNSSKSTNDLYLPGLNTRNVKLNTTDGDIHLSRLKAHNMKAFSSDGDIYLSHLNADNIKTFSNDGDIYLSHVNTNKSFIHTYDGDIHLFDLSSKTLVHHTNDGDTYTHNIAK